MADVAEQAGVSVATVSRALRDIDGVSDSTRERVRRVAERLAYVVSPEASGLARRATGRVAVVVPRIDIWFYASMLAGVEAVLRAAQLDVLVYQVDGQDERSRFVAELPARRKVDAVVLIALPLPPDDAARLDLLGVQVVVAGGRLRDYPCVHTDDRAVAMTAVNHLVDLGHRRIAMIRTNDTDGTHWSSDMERTRGYRDALEHRGIRIRDDYLVTVPFGVSAGSRAMQQLMALAQPPTAVFAYSDELALGALRALEEAGVPIPEQMSLVGVDGHPLAGLFGLDTVDQFVEAQGRLAGEIAVTLLQGGNLESTEVLLPFELVRRGSTGPAPDR